MEKKKKCNENKKKGRRLKGQTVGLEDDLGAEKDENIGGKGLLVFCANKHHKAEMENSLWKTVGHLKWVRCVKV